MSKVYCFECKNEMDQVEEFCPNCGLYLGGIGTVDVLKMYLFEVSKRKRYGFFLYMLTWFNFFTYDLSNHEVGLFFIAWLTFLICAAFMYQGGQNQISYSLFCIALILGTSIPHLLYDTKILDRLISLGILENIYVKWQFIGFLNSKLRILRAMGYGAQTNVFKTSLLVIAMYTLIKKRLQSHKMPKRQ